MAFATVFRANGATWTGAVNQDWQNSGNWSPAILPGSGDVAVINTGIANISGQSSISTFKLQVADTGTASLRISDPKLFSTQSATIGNLANGRGFVTVSGETTSRVGLPWIDKSLWQNKGNILVGNIGTGVLEIRNGGSVSTDQITVSSGDSLLSVAGVNPLKNRSYLIAKTAMINGMVDVSDGGSFGGTNVEIGGLAMVSGVNASGSQSLLSANALTLKGHLKVLDGAVAKSDRGFISGNFTISGVSSKGRRSSWTTGSSATDGFKTTKINILDGGILNSRTFHVTMLDPAIPNIVEVSGVSSGGYSSTLDVDSLIISRGGLVVTDGGVVDAGFVQMSNDPDSTIDVAGTSSGGRSTLLTTDSRIDMQSGRFTVRDGAVLECVGFDASGYQDALLTFDGGTYRSKASGANFRNYLGGQIQIATGGVTFDTREHDNTIDNSLDGTGSLTKLGTGRLELTVANNYEGDTHVLEGLLVLNNKTGSATGGGDVHVDSLGAVGGNGSIAGNLFNKGTVSPGNSPGTLTIGGDFHQDAGGTLAIEIASPDKFDVLHVRGDVNLAGTLEIDSETALEFGLQFGFIESEGEFNGDFDSISVSSPGGARGRVSYSDGIATLTIAPTTYAAVAATPNETSLARALSAWIDDTTGDTLTVAENLDQLNAAGYHAAFADISPALYGAAVATGIEQSQSQSSSLVQFLNSRRLGQSPLGEGGKDWEAWALTTGLYSPGSMSSLDGSEFTSGNFLSGIEHRIDTTFTAGIFASTGDSRGEFAGASLIKQDRFTLGGYATAQRDGYYATTALGGGVLEAHVTRDIEFAGLSREAHSHTDGTEFFSLIAGGYDFRQSNWTFGPTASLQYSKVRYDDVKEKGAGALNLAVGNPEDDSLRSLIGGRVAYHHKASETLTLVPEARVSWQHEFFRNNDTLDASLQQGAGPGFSHQLADSDGDSVAAGLALGFQTLIGFYGNVSYDVEIGRESEVNQTLSVGADWKF